MEAVSALAAVYGLVIVVHPHKLQAEVSQRHGDPVEANQAHVDLVEGSLKCSYSFLAVGFAVMAAVLPNFQTLAEEEEEEAYFRIGVSE